MKLQRLGSLFVVSVACCLAAAACGDDSGSVVDQGSDDDDTGSSGGSSNDGDSPTTGGSPSSSSGGNSSTGGAANDDACPDAEPQGFSNCTASTTGGPPTTCTYDDTDCTCANGIWLCQDNTQDEDCPANAPQDGSGCDGLDGTSCDYGFQGACSCEEGEWSCDTADNCPEAAPAAGSQCFGSEGSSCDYDAGACTCTTDTSGGNFSSTWECEGSDPDATGCPENAPDVGGDCEATGAACEYSDQICACGSTGGTNEWQCIDTGDEGDGCPADAPESGAGCSGDSVCAYSDSTCICAPEELDGWFCV